MKIKEILHSILDVFIILLTSCSIAGDGRAFQVALVQFGAC